MFLIYDNTHKEWKSAEVYDFWKKLAHTCACSVYQALTYLIGAWLIGEILLSLLSSRCLPIPLLVEVEAEAGEDALDSEI